MRTDRKGLALLFCLLPAFHASVALSEIDFEERVEEIRVLNVTAPWQESQALVDELKPHLHAATPRQQTQIALIEARNRALAGDLRASLAMVAGILESDPDIDLKIRGYSLAANVAMNMGDYEQAFIHMRDGLDLLAQVDVPAAKAGMLDHATFALSEIGEHERALAYGTQAVEFARASGEKRSLCVALQRFAVAQKRTLPPEQVETTLWEALEACSEANDPVYIAATQQMLGEMQVAQGRLEEGLEWLETGIAGAEKSGYPRGVWDGKRYYAEALLELGELQRARALLDEVVREFEASDSWRDLAEVRALRSEVMERQGEPIAALRELRLARAADRDHQDEQRLMRTDYVQVEFETRRREQALAVLEEQNRLNTTLRNGAAAGALMMLLLVLVVVNRYRIKTLAGRAIEKKNRELATLNEILSAINARDSFQAVLSILLQRTVAFFEKADRGEILVRDSEDRCFETECIYSDDDIGYMPEPEAIHDAIRRYTRQGRELAQGVYLHDRLPADGGGRGCAGRRGSMVAMSIPIDGRIEGFMLLLNTREETAFRAADADRFSRIRSHAISALTRAQNLAKLKTENRRADEAIRDLRNTQKALEQALEAAESANFAKSEFLARVSHELRTPLHAIIGYSSKLSRQAKKGSSGAEGSTDVDYIHSSGEHLLTLINEILDLSSIEAGKASLSLERVDVAGLVRHVTEISRPQVEENDNQLMLECSEEIGVIHTDATKLRQILFNLLSNAARFTRDGRIRLTVTALPAAGEQGMDEILFTISDTGIGIEVADRERIFDAFVQGGSGHSQKQGGKGLGLTISMRLCQLLQGDLSVDSTPGEGAVFSLRIPRWLDQLTVEEVEGVEGVEGVESAGESIVPGMAAPNERSAGQRILVVEDNPVNRRLMSDYLHMEGFEVIEAVDGSEGIDKARGEKPDLILMDLSLPGMSGSEATRLMKQDRDLADIPVIAVSAYATSEARDQAMEAGCDAYETKPVNFEQLVGLVRQLIHDQPQG